MLEGKQHTIANTVIRQYQKRDAPMIKSTAVVVSLLRGFLHPTFHTVYGYECDKYN